MTKTYTRRTPEQIVADLEAKIEAVKARAAARETKATPEGKAFLTAVKAVDKAIEAARAAGNEPMFGALEAGRAPLSAYGIEMGIRMPERKPRQKRRRKGAAA